MKIYFFFCCTLFGFNLYSQDLYFPPIDSDEWETTSMDELGWCEDSLTLLCDYLEDRNSKAFLVLKDGKIVIEKYFDEFTKDSLWYWASAGKTITSFLTGIANQEGSIALTDPTSDYLGEGWTSCTPEQENAITIRNQLTMTSGLYDNPDDPHCTDPECLVYEADAGAEWAYHNGPYTLLGEVINAATGMSLNMYCNNRLEATTGMSGIFVPIDYTTVYFSKPRDMARFGLLMNNNGTWGTDEVMTDADYFNAMINTSQDLNKSYGYLWWLNGKESLMLPSTEMVFDGPLIPNAPNDMYAALGKNGQILNIVPSQNLIIVRMGDNPDEPDAAISATFNNEIWAYLNGVFCGNIGLSEVEPINKLVMYPNPAQAYIQFEDVGFERYILFNSLGQEIKAGIVNSGLNTITLAELETGIYHISLFGKNIQETRQIVID